MPQHLIIQTPIGNRPVPIPPYWLILHSLFFRPCTAFFMLQYFSRWFRGLMIIILIAACGSFFKVLSDFPSQATTGHRMASFVSSELGTISYKDGRIDWTESPALPLTGHIHDARIDVCDSKNDFSQKVLKDEIASKGIVICHDAILFWKNAPYGANERIIMNLLAAPGVKDNLKVLIDNGSLPSSFDSKQLLRYVRLVCVAMVPGLFITSMLDFLKVIVFSTFFFTLFQVLFRHGAWRDAGKIFSLGLHACIPPFLTALVYYIPDFFHVSFDTAFWTAMLIYMLWIYYDKRQVMHTMDELV